MAEYKIEDEIYMTAALEEAKKASDIGEVPVGAVIVHGGEIIASAHNRREADKNAISHAEIICINNACNALGGWRLPECTLYVTLEPCPMCAGAVINSRIDRVVFGAYDNRFGSFGSLINLSEYPFNHKPQICGGVLESEAKSLLKSFFLKLRK